MFWLLPILLLTLRIVEASYNNIVIWHNTITSSERKLKYDGVTILKDASWSIFNNDDFSYVGSFINDASMFLTSTSTSRALKFSDGHSLSTFTNNGLMVLDSRSTSLHASSYLWTGRSFVNTGDLYLVTSASPHSATSSLKSKSVSNSGTIVLYRNPNLKNRGEFVTPHSANEMINNGQICLYNHEFEQSGTISGSGCITIQKNSRVALKTTYTASNQIFVLADTSSILSAPGKEEATYKVAGFGDGNIISIGLKLAGKGKEAPWDYDPQSGILTMRHLSYQKNFQIGKGYDKGFFRVVSSDNTNDALSYAAPVPNGALKADHCPRCQSVIPQAVGVEPGSYTTKYVTVENGMERTATAIVSIEHNAYGDVEIHSIPLGETTDAIKDPITSAFGVVHEVAVGAIETNTVGVVDPDAKPTGVVHGELESNEEGEEKEPSRGDGDGAEQVQEPGLVEPNVPVATPMESKAPQATPTEPNVPDLTDSQGETEPATDNEGETEPTADNQSEPEPSEPATESQAGPEQPVDIIDPTKPDEEKGNATNDKEEESSPTATQPDNHNFGLAPGSNNETPASAIATETTTIATEGVNQETIEPEVSDAEAAQATENLVEPQPEPQLEVSDLVDPATSEPATDDQREPEQSGDNVDLETSEEQDTTTKDKDGELVATATQPDNHNFGIRPGFDKETTTGATTGTTVAEAGNTETTEPEASDTKPNEPEPETDNQGESEQTGDKQDTTTKDKDGELVATAIQPGIHNFGVLPDRHHETTAGATAGTTTTATAAGRPVDSELEGDDDNEEDRQEGGSGAELNGEAGNVDNTQGAGSSSLSESTTTGEPSSEEKKESVQLESASDLSFFGDSQSATTTTTESQATTLNLGAKTEEGNQQAIAPLEVVDPQKPATSDKPEAAITTGQVSGSEGSPEGETTDAPELTMSLELASDLSFSEDVTWDETHSTEVPATGSDTSARFESASEVSFFSDLEQTQLPSSAKKEIQSVAEINGSQITGGVINGQLIAGSSVSENPDLGSASNMETSETPSLVLASEVNIGSESDVNGDPNKSPSTTSKIKEPSRLPNKPASLTVSPDVPTSTSDGTPDHLTSVTDNGTLISEKEPEATFTLESASGILIESDSDDTVATSSSSSDADGSMVLQSPSEIVIAAVSSDVDKLPIAASSAGSSNNNAQASPLSEIPVTVDSQTQPNTLFGQTIAETATKSHDEAEVTHVSTYPDASDVHSAHHSIGSTSPLTFPSHASVAGESMIITAFFSSTIPLDIAFIRTSNDHYTEPSFAESFAETQLFELSHAMTHSTDESTKPVSVVTPPTMTTHVAVETGVMGATGTDDGEVTFVSASQIEIVDSMVTPDGGETTQMSSYDGEPHGSTWVNPSDVSISDDGEYEGTPSASLDSEDGTMTDGPAVTDTSEGSKKGSSTTKKESKSSAKPLKSSSSKKSEETVVYTSSKNTRTKSSSSTTKTKKSSSLTTSSSPTTSTMHVSVIDGSAVVVVGSTTLFLSVADEHSSSSTGPELLNPSAMYISESHTGRHSSSYEGDFAYDASLAAGVPSGSEYEFTETSYDVAIDSVGEHGHHSGDLDEQRGVSPLVHESHQGNQDGNVLHETNKHGQENSEGATTTKDSGSSGATTTTTTHELDPGYSTETDGLKDTSDEYNWHASDADNYHKVPLDKVDLEFDSMCLIESIITVLHNTCHPSATLLFEISATLIGGAAPNAEGRAMSFFPPFAIFAALIFIL
ncbi:hypothetical protein Cantr_01216 [Candida viswanathii]|uniref:Hyphally-regulated cell wall protein N-terminal domain-containing protein n=1 Tax=Candida viswanathii TaxID=5486 RepID=A0A367YI41_9ASCO|nr:hypothetical protein Cantr_01216 [Candida viswanathii]